MKITGIYGLIMITLVASFLSTATEAERRGPHTCEDFFDPNAVCEVTNNGWGRHFHCLEGYIRSPNSTNCVPEKQIIASERGPHTCENFFDFNAVCTITDNGWGSIIRCRYGYVYSQDENKCVPEQQIGVDSRGRKTCDDHSDVNAVCTANSDGSVVTILCDPGYVLPLGSDKCISKATIRGYYTCEGFSAANAVCEVIDNGWAKDIRCLDGYVRTPHSDNCILKDNSYPA